MIAWLYALLVGRLCRHSWETIRSGPRGSESKVVGFYYDQLCEKCGDIRRKKT